MEELLMKLKELKQIVGEENINREAVSSYECIIKDVQVDKQGDSFLYIGMALDEIEDDYSYSAIFINEAFKYYFKSGIQGNHLILYDNFVQRFMEKGAFEYAISLSQTVLEYALPSLDKICLVQCYSNIGTALTYLGDFNSAISYHKKALAISEETKDETMVAGCYLRTGLTYRNIGELNKALEFYETGLNICRRMGNKLLESKFYTNMGRIYNEQGIPGKSLEYIEKSMEIKLDIGDGVGISACHIGLGHTYELIGDYKKAFYHFSKALRISITNKNKVEISDNLINICGILSILGKAKAAVHFGEIILKMETIIKRKGVIANVYGNLGIAYIKMGDVKAAINLYKKSIEINEAENSILSLSISHLNLSSAYSKLGSAARTMEHLEKATYANSKVHDLNVEKEINLLLSQHYNNKCNDFELAFLHAEKAVESVEKMVGRIMGEEHKINFISNNTIVYQNMITLCLKMGKQKEAFEYLERSKSKAFLELLSTTKISCYAGERRELGDLLERERVFLDNLKLIQTNHLRKQKVEIEIDEMDKILFQLENVRIEIEKLSPKYAYIQSGKSLDLNSTIDIIKQNNRNMAMVEYFVTGDRVIIFIISSRDGKLNVVDVKISIKRLYQYVVDYWRSVANYRGFKTGQDIWLELSEYIVKPIFDYVQEGDLIYFIPHLMLHYLPLHALRYNGKPIIKTNPIAYLPSASMMKFFQNRNINTLDTLAAFGVAFQKEEEVDKKEKEIFEREAVVISKLFKSDVFIGENATKEQLMKSGLTSDILHLSCHGEISYVDPFSSGIKLFDGKLTARDIYNSRINAKLITLSACETGLNNWSRGDELVGLTRACIFAGADTLVVSLWSVDAFSTTELMTEFYKAIKNGVDMATALQQAQIRVMDKAEYTHPYYWAPFVLVGNWR